MFYVILYILEFLIFFEERSELNIKTWTVICKLLYSDHFAYFILQLGMFAQLLFTNRACGSAIHLQDTKNQSTKYIIKRLSQNNSRYTDPPERMRYIEHLKELYSTSLLLALNSSTTIYSFNLYRNFIPHL